MIEDLPAPPRAVVFDADAQDWIDITSTDVIEGMLRQLRARGVEVFFANVHAPVLERARTTGLLDTVGEDHVFPTLDAAVEHAEGLLRATPRGEVTEAP
jgi:SulP family sulfate permease